MRASFTKITISSQLYCYFDNGLSTLALADLPDSSSWFWVFLVLLPIWGADGRPIWLDREEEGRGHIIYSGNIQTSIGHDQHGFHSWRLLKSGGIIV